MAFCLVSIGSNCNKTENMLLARRELLRIFPSVRFSDITETRPISISNPEYFYNQVACFQTDYTVSVLKELLKSIEILSGREPSNRDQIPLDIDLIIYGTDIIKPSELERDYVVSSIEKLNLKLRCQ